MRHPRLLLALAACLLAGCIKVERTFPKSVPVDASLAVGARATDFTLPRLGGDPLRLSSQRGRVVVLCFFSLYCHSCREELRAMEQLQQKYRDRGLVVVAISVNGELEEFRSHFTPADGWPTVSFPILIDDDDQAGLGASYSFAGVPRIYLLDRDQRIRERPAIAPDSEQDLQARAKQAMALLPTQIERLLDEPAPP